MANEAIGILFEVDGQGDISKGSGKRINGQLRHLVGQINKSSTVKLNFKIDESAIQKQLKSIQDRIKEIEKQASSQTQKKGDNKDSGATGQTSAYQQAKKAIADYYAAKTKYERKASRTTSPETEYKDLLRALNAAKIAGQNYFEVTTNGSVKLKDSIADVTAEQYESLKAFRNSQGLKSQAESTDIVKNAQAAWSNLTQKVNDYIRRVEYSASRDEKAAQALKELRDLANSTDYHGYDELKKKLAEVNQYINQNSLDTETWGQKMVKTFGSRIRSALAGIITAKIGQYIKEVYDNVLKLDAAMTNLQIASGKTREEIEALTGSYAKLAQQLGATTVEVAEAADTWLRQGYVTEEANTLIANSTMLAKLGQMEATEASTALTSAMKGYGVAVADSINIVDKFTKVDMEAAASAGDIAAAMAETATSAKLAGVSMDTLIGYIATVKEVTQDSAESVGTFYKTLFARMNNVAAGNFVDEETGESLNDVETVLNKLGIALRDTNGEFRESGAVLSDVAARWQTFDNVSQHAIATAFAGTRQQEKFIVLMENYGTAMSYASSATASSGTAMEKYGAYTDSLEGRLNSLTASFEEFSATILDSDLVAFFIDIMNGAVNALNAVTSFGDGIVTILLIVSAATIAAFTLIGVAATKLKGHLDLLKTSFINALKNPLTYMTILTSLFIAFQDDMNGTVKFLVGLLAIAATAFSVFCILVKTGAISTAATVSTAIMNIPIFGWIIAIIQAVIIAFTALIGAFDAWIETDAEARESALEVAAAMQEEANAMKEVADAAAEAANSVRTLVDELEELQDSGDLDASEWMDKIQAIGDEVAALYPDEHLTSLQAINRLLDEELSYNDLINLSMQERIDLLNDIEKGTAEVKAQTATEAYRAQKQAGEMLAGALTDYGYEITDGDDLWGNTKGNQIKSAIKEAEEISSLLNNGVTLSGNVGKDIDISVEASNLSEYVEKLRAVVDEYEDRYEYNFGALSQNAIYQYLSSSLSEAETSLNAQLGALESVVESVAEISGTNLNLEFDENTTKDEAKEIYSNAINSLIQGMQANDDISRAISENLIDEDDLQEAANEYMRQFHEDLYNAANDMPVFITLKSAIDIFDEIEDEFDLLTDAIDEFNKSGTVSADTIRSITDEFPELLKYINQTENGFEMLGQTMDEILNDYWESKAKNYADNITAAYEYYEAAKNAYDGTLESYQIVNSAYTELREAIESGNNFITAQNVLTDDLLEEQYTEILEEQKEALEANADAFEELCDIRKELLKTYADEVDYQKQLEKKQRSVSKLQTQLSVAKLDTSAAGQARVRELEAELQEAQDELDEFTLEHAIDILTAQIEAENSQYQQLINSSVERLAAKMDEVGKMSSDAISAAIIEAGKTPVVSGDSVAGGATSSITGAISGAQQGVTGSSGTTLPEKAPIQAPTTYVEPEPDPVVVPEPKSKLEYKTDYSVSGLSGGLSWGKDDISVTIGDHTYDVKVETSEASSSASNALDKLYGGDRPDNGRIAPYNGTLYITKKGTWRKLVEEDISSLTSKYTKLLNEYHTGGFVGDFNNLASNEEFAKLLKGEFVSTPAQMKKFMEETLPAIASYQSSGGSNEFNAPLVEIICESVTSESMPELKRVVDEAVKEIKKQLDSGMSRTGYKRSVKTI